MRALVLLLLCVWCSYSHQGTDGFTSSPGQTGSGTLAVSGSGDVGVPNQQPLILGCNYTVRPGENVTEFRWSRVDGGTTVDIVRGTVDPPTATFLDSWQDKAWFTGDYTSSLNIMLKVFQVRPSYAGSYRCTVGGASGAADEVEVTASILTIVPQDLSLLIGDEVTLTCTVTSDILNASNMYFTKRHNSIQHTWDMCRNKTRKKRYFQKPISSEYVTVINSTTIQLKYRTQEAKVDEGHYRCCLCENNRPHVAFSNIKLYRRMEPVTNVSCVVDNWATMTCSWPWDIGPQSDSNIHRARLNWGTNGVPNQVCVDDSVPGSCHWPADSFSMGSLYTIVVNITTSDNGSILDMKVSNPSVVNTSEIVRPATLTDINATNFNNTCVLLSWQQVDTHRLACRIQYNCSIWQESCQPVDNVSDGSASVCGLLSGTVYQWNVSCLPAGGGFWSNVTTVLHTTQTDVPASQPEVHLGSFLEVDCNQDNCRGILLFWKAVPAHLRNGPITAYHIFVQDTATGNETDITVTDMAQMSLELHLEPNTTYQIQTSACTESGCSTRSKLITIAPQGKGVSPPQDFTVEFMADEDPANFNINWQPLHTRVVSYTMYWCMKDENSTNCTTPLDWKSVSPNTTEYNLTLPGLSENTTQDYMVGISAEAMMTSRRSRRASDTGQVTSSGISWSQCLHISGKTPTAAPEVLHMSSHPTTASIDLEWQKLSCLQTPSVLTGVLVVYCVVDGDSCSGPEQSQMAVGQGVSYTLKNLDTGNTYLIKVCAVSAAGNGPFSPPVKVELAADLALIYTAVIVASVLLLLLFIIFCVIWGCCTIQQNIKMEVAYPQNKLQLLQHDDDIDKKATHPENNASAKNRTYWKSGTDKDRAVDKELEDTKLLPSESYKENASIRWRESLGPKITDTCYMASSAKKNSLELKPENREKNGWTQLTDTMDPYEIVDSDGVDIPRERLSSFKSHLPVREYCYVVKGDIDYENYVTAESEQEYSSHPLITDPKELQELHDKVHPHFHSTNLDIVPPHPQFIPSSTNVSAFVTVQHTHDDQLSKLDHPPPTSLQNYPPPPKAFFATQANPLPDYRAVGDPPSDQNLLKNPPTPNVQYSTNSAHLQTNKSTTYVIDPPSPQLPHRQSLPRPACVSSSGTFPHVQRHTFIEEQNHPPPATTCNSPNHNNKIHMHEQNPFQYLQNEYSYLTSDNSITVSEQNDNESTKEQYTPINTIPVQIPKPPNPPRPASVSNPVPAEPVQNKETIDPKHPPPNLQNEPLPRDKNSPITAAPIQNNKEQKQEKDIPHPLTIITPVQIPKPRTSLQSPKPFKPVPPEPVAQNTGRDTTDGRIKNEPEQKQEPEPMRTNVTPGSNEPDNKSTNDKKPWQLSSEIPRNRGSVDKSTQENLPPLPSYSSRPPSAKSRPSKKTDEDNNVFDISILVGELLGEGLTTKKDEDGPEVTTRPTKLRGSTSLRDAKVKPKPPEVPPKPMFVTARHSNLGHVEVSPTAVSDPPAVCNRREF
ncbi:uncharacterized protein LOC124114806 [Haliotis rufescens]|uniref:uncharacterized protein LOC124114806 n=1 Tax=Haliotis rufescens TaxID=6454 RepID=UPI00201EA22D|nr:uncharacterized protein LOC124114806 [Haliotis rufescens]